MMQRQEGGREKTPGVLECTGKPARRGLSAERRIENQPPRGGIVARRGMKFCKEEGVKS